MLFLRGGCNCILRTESNETIEEDRCTEARQVTQALEKSEISPPARPDSSSGGESDDEINLLGSDDPDLVATLKASLKSNSTFNPFAKLVTRNISSEQRALNELLMQAASDGNVNATSDLVRRGAEVTSSQSLHHSEVQVSAAL